MATLAETHSPPPHDVFASLQHLLNPFAPKLNKLPTALELFAHLQLLSTQLKSEARRALRAHTNLMRKLDEIDVDDAERLDMGVLSEEQGKALRDVALQGEVTREDIMMELSLEFRLLHIAMAVSRIRDTLPKHFIPLFETYFPLLPASLQSDDRDNVNLIGGNPEDWESWVSTQKYCYNRALTPSQGLRMDYYRKRGEGLIDKAKRHAASTDPFKGKLRLSDLLQNRTDESAKQLAQNVLYQAEKVIEDLETMQQIFGSEEVPDESQPLEVDHAPTDDIRDVQGLPADDYYEDAVEAEEDDGVENRTMDSSSRFDRPILVTDKRRGLAQSPPALRAFPQLPHSSSHKPFRGSSIASTPGPGPSTSRYRQQQLNAGEVSSPTTKVLHKSRKSGLAPLIGPDYISPRTSSRYIKEELKPFDQSRVIRSPQMDKAKRSRLSLGYGTASVDEEHRRKRTRESSY